MRTVLTIISLTICGVLAAQDSSSRDPYLNAKYIGFNANPLLSQLIPFNKIDPFNNDVGIIARTYWNGHGLRASYGFGVGDPVSARNHMTMSVGYDRRRYLGKKFYYNKGFDVVLRVLESDFNNPPPATNFNQQSMFGIGMNWGIEYIVNPIISVSTESSLRFGANLDNGDAIFSLVPPISFRVHFNITKKNTTFD